MRVNPVPLSRGLLRVHLLGRVEFEELLRLQRGLVYRLSGNEVGAALLLCEHAPLLTVGRHGGLPSVAWRDECQNRNWPVRWVARGGGSILHLPGQLAVYPLLPLGRYGLDVSQFVGELQRVLLDTLDDFGIRGKVQVNDASISIQDRTIAQLGVALRQQISTFGAILNVDPDLTLLRSLRSDGQQLFAWTSIVRERRAPLRPQLVRQRLIEHFAQRFEFDEVDLIFPQTDQLNQTRLIVRSNL